MSMTMNSKTPLWLDIKTEYIDDNFEKLVEYLSDSNTSRDSFFQTTVALLKRRVDMLVEEIAKRDLPMDEMEMEGRSFNIRLLACWLLTNSDDEENVKAFVALLAELKCMVPKFSESLLKVAISTIKHPTISAYGFKWDDIRVFAPEIFAYKLIHNYVCIEKDTDKRVFTNMGSVWCDDASLYVFDKKTDGYVKGCVPSANFGFGIYAVSDSLAKIKQSQAKSVEMICSFTTDFIANMQNGVAQKAKLVGKKLYNDGDEVLVRVVDVVGQRIIVETTDAKHEKIVGDVVFKRPSINYYYVSSFYTILKKGMIMRAVLNSVAKREFDIESTFLDFLVNDSKDSYEGAMLAKMIDDRNGKLVWLTDFGTPIYTPKCGSYVKGNYAYIDNLKYGTGQYYGKIDGKVVYEAGDGDVFDEDEVRKECIQTFADEVLPTESNNNAGHKALNPMCLRLLVRLLFAHQKHIMNPVDRMMTLSAANILAVVVGDNDAAEYVNFASTYLRVLIRFAREEDIADITIQVPDVYKGSQSALLRLSVVELLKMWGKKGVEDRLNDTVATFKDTLPMLSRLAQIIQTSNSMREIVTDASINVLKREIIKMLSIETENESDLEAANGIYLGVESGSVEFKRSIVYAADSNMQPDQVRQTKNVLKGVCAFLNSTSGGVLYLGVSDQGYVTGIQGDLDALRIGSIDLYMRVHIQDQIKKLIGIDVLPYITIEPMYDEQVIAIRVESFPYRIAEMDGKAYIRVNAESREMTGAMREQLLERKVFSKSGRAANLSMLLNAIDERRCVVLHNYSSSNSGVFSDRRLEVYNVEPSHNLLMAFDMKDSKCKVFNINRIGYVEILDDKWSHTFQHQPIKVDHFHMSGTEEIRCFLQLDMMARNLLIEEFPTAKDDITKAGDDNTWYFTTNVYNLYGIGRFYIGLANHIKIIDAPQLKEYAKDFKDRYIV